MGFYLCASVVSLSLSFSLYSSNTILHYSFCSLLHAAALSNIVEVLVTVGRRLMFALVYGPLRLVMVLNLLLLLLVFEESSGGAVLIRVALILLDEAGIQEYHAFVHDFQVRRHQIEVAYELLVDQTVHLVRAPDLNNEGLMLSLLVLGRHHEVTTS